MLTTISIFIISLVILIFSSELFTINAVKLARLFGVSHFFIGITVVGIGTSMPEIVITDYASLMGECGIVLGNVIGSNITNIALVLGFAIFIRNVVITGDHMFKDSIVHFLVLGLGCIIILTGNIINRFEGVILVLIYFAYIQYLLKSHKKPTEDDIADDVEISAKTIIFTLLGLAGVVGGSKLLVDSAVILASGLGISNSVIGLTVIALGTSLPELAVSISAARRGFMMLILGNIVGSNITNMVLAMGTASVINDVIVVDSNLFHYNLILLMVLSFILIIAVKKRKISRWWGLLFMIMYVFFIGFSISA